MYVTIISNMPDNIFLPRLKNLNKDNLSSWLQGIARFIFIFTFGLLPIFFIPGVYASLGFTKSYFVIIGVFAVIILFSLSILRQGAMKFTLPLALILFWFFTIIMLASALLSGDRTDALFGNALEVHTAGFFVLMGVIMTVSLVFGGSKTAIARLLIVSGLSTFVLLLIQNLRLFFGPDFLSFGLLTTNTSSFVGSFNDLAIFSGLVIIITLLLAQNLIFSLFTRIGMVVILVLSLSILAIVNFTAIWLIVGLFSLLMLLYVLSRDTWLKVSDAEQNPVSKFTLVMIALVVLFSSVFVIAGNYLGSALSNFSHISYLEVRPSVGATFDIAKGVFTENAFLGIGANRFEDAWRQYKDPIINQTDFWNTDFTAGSSLVTTLFVTTGMVGGIIFILFLMSFIYVGYRTLFVNKIDNNWYLVGIITFTSAIYLWLVTIVYVPGATIMLITALITGLAFAVYCYTNPDIGTKINIIENRHYGVLLIIVVLAIIIASTYAVFTISKQFLAQKNYTNVIRDFKPDSNIIDIDNGLQKSQQLFAQDIFVAERARLRLTELNKLVTLPEPTQLDQQNFQALLVEGISLSEQAIALDSSNPFNYALLTSFYGLLNPTQATEIQTRKDDLIKQTIALDPTNPSYQVLFAQLSARFGDFEKARVYLNESISLKNNYTDALFLLSQLDIEEGKTENAIKVTQDILSIEPYNPTRYFQLGLLLAKVDKISDAIKAFEQAIILDNNYANARYFLALAYLDTDRKNDAIVQLKIIETLNPDNQMIKQLIAEVEANKFVKPDAGFGVPVNDYSVVDQEDGDITTSTKVPETDLINPLNKNNSTTEDEEVIKNINVSESTTTESTQ